METTTLIANIVDQLKTIPGVEVVVLGGSRACGTHTKGTKFVYGKYKLCFTANGLFEN